MINPNPRLMEESMLPWEVQLRFLPVETSNKQFAYKPKGVSTVALQGGAVVSAVKTRRANTAHLVPCLLHTDTMAKTIKRNANMSPT